MDKDEEILIIAIKGTSMGFLGGGGPTVPRDKQNVSMKKKISFLYTVKVVYIT